MFLEMYSHYKRINFKADFANLWSLKPEGIFVWLENWFSSAHNYLWELPLNSRSPFYHQDMQKANRVLQKLMVKMQKMVVKMQFSKEKQSLLVRFEKAVGRRRRSYWFLTLSTFIFNMPKGDTREIFAISKMSREFIALFFLQFHHSFGQLATLIWHDRIIHQMGPVVVLQSNINLELFIKWTWEMMDQLYKMKPFSCKSD